MKMFSVAALVVLSAHYGYAQCTTDMCPIQDLACQSTDVVNPINPVVYHSINYEQPSFQAFPQQIVQPYNHAMTSQRIENTRVGGQLSKQEMIDFIKYARASHVYHMYGGQGTPQFHQNWLVVYDQVVAQLMRQ